MFVIPDIYRVSNKRWHFYILNNSFKNEPIFVIFGSRIRVTFYYVNDYKLVHRIWKKYQRKAGTLWNADLLHLIEVSVSLTKYRLVGALFRDTPAD